MLRACLKGCRPKVRLFEVEMEDARTGTGAYNVFSSNPLAEREQEHGNGDDFIAMCAQQFDDAGSREIHAVVVLCPDAFVPDLRKGIKETLGVAHAFRKFEHGACGWSITGGGEAKDLRLDVVFEFLFAGEATVARCTG